MTAACRRPEWNPSDAKPKPLVLAACTALHGHYEPHTKIPARAGRDKARKTFARWRAMGRANPEETVARRKDRAAFCRLGLRLLPFHREPRLQGPHPRCRGKAHWLVCGPNARIAPWDPRTSP